MEMFQIPTFKACGFTFSVEQLKETVANYYNDGKDLQEVTASTTLGSEHSDDGFDNIYFLAVRFVPLTGQETYDNYEAITFDPTDKELKRKVEWLGKLGCTEESLKSRWMTFSEWSFFEHVESEIDNNAEGEGKSKGWKRPMLPDWLWLSW